MDTPILLLFYTKTNNPSFQTILNIFFVRLLCII